MQKSCIFEAEQVMLRASVRMLICEPRILYCASWGGREASALFGIIVLGVVSAKSVVYIGPLVDSGPLRFPRGCRVLYVRSGNKFSA